MSRNRIATSRIRYTVAFPVLIFSLLFVAAVVSYAHHGWAEFNQEEEITITGMVENPLFEYPHATMDLITDEGSAWSIIMAPPRRIQRMGVTGDNLVEGKTVTVTGHPHRENENMMRIFEIEIDDETLYIR